jgi:hypothetical protein
MTKPQFSFIIVVNFSTPKAPGNCGKDFYSSSHHDENEWIIDSRATNHMTFDLADFSYTTQP